MSGSGPCLDEFVDEHGTAVGWHYIYGLFDPRTGELRYIGKSDRPRERLGNQMNEQGNTHRCHWLQELRGLGLRPEQVILDAVPPGTDWQTVERAYIAAARLDGHRLTNGTDGGDGVSGLSEASRARITSAWLGRRHSPQTLQKMSERRRGRRHTDAWRQAMSDRFRGRAFSDDHRRKISAGLNKLTDQQVRDIRTALASGERQRDIAARFDIHQGSVSNIARGITYRDVR